MPNELERIQERVIASSTFTQHAVWMVAEAGDNLVSAEETLMHVRGDSADAQLQEAANNLAAARATIVELLGALPQLSTFFESYLNTLGMGSTEEIVGAELRTAGQNASQPSKKTVSPRNLADHTFITGALDPEMNRIHSILTDIGAAVIRATVDGRPVHPGNAYEADAVEVPPGITNVVLVECEPKDIKTTEPATVVRIDHHRPGDPGHGLPAGDYWKASSIGQLYKLLGIKSAPSSDRTLAAMDHCYSDAILGKCPGVSSETVLDRKIAEIAQAHDVSEAHVQTKVDEVSQEIAARSVVSFGDVGEVVDLTDTHQGTGYSLDLLVAQTAVVRTGRVALLRHRQREGAPDVITLSGHATPDMVDYFINTWAPQAGLTRIYGSASRGYAGGYTE